MLQPLPGATQFPCALMSIAVAYASPVVRKPPMGWSTWNQFNLKPTAPLLLDMADAFTSTGLKKSGYDIFTASDGWLDKNRTADGDLQPAASFTNQTGGIVALGHALANKGFKFGIFLGIFVVCLFFFLLSTPLSSLLSCPLPSSPFLSSPLVSSRLLSFGWECWLRILSLLLVWVRVPLWPC